VSSGSFPPVQTNKQAALGYGQVGPVAPETGSFIRAHEQDRAGGLEKICSASCPGPALTGLKHPSYLMATNLVALEGNINGEESRTKDSRETLAGRVDSHRIQLRSECLSSRVLAQHQGPEHNSCF
jgi:hypothetical protein